MLNHFVPGLYDKVSQASQLADTGECNIKERCLAQFLFRCDPWFPGVVVGSNEVGVECGGNLVNPRFSRYRVPRFSDVPALETVLVDREDLPSAGAGENPIVALAPRIGQRHLPGYWHPPQVASIARGGLKGKS